MDQFEKEPKVIRQMIDYQVDRKMEKIKLDLTRVQMCENPLVIMMLEEKMRVD